MEIIEKDQLGLGNYCKNKNCSGTEEDPKYPCFSKPAKLALSSFVACQHPVESCRHNGLPLTPNSTSIIGKAQILKSICHPNLCTYLDCQRGKGERIIVASEYYEDCSLKDVGLNVLNNKIKCNSTNNNEDSQIDNKNSENCCDKDEFLLNILARQILRGLIYLDYNTIVHVNLEPKNILITNREKKCTNSCQTGLDALIKAQNLKVKLYDYGLGHMTNYGEFVAFPVFVNPAFTPPEIFLENPIDQGEIASSITPEDDGANCDSIVYIEPSPPPKYSSNCATWSLGMILFCQILGIARPWPNLKASQTVRKVLSLSKFKGSVLERLAREHNGEDVLKNISPSLKKFIDLCLTADPGKRLKPKELWNCTFNHDDSDNLYVNSTFPTLKLRCQNMKSSIVNLTDDIKLRENGHSSNFITDSEESDELDETALDVINIHEIYYLWQLAGGDSLSELRRCGFIVNRPAILSLPSMVLNEGHIHGQTKEKSSLYDPSIVSLNLSQLTSCLDSLTCDDLYPTCEDFLADAPQSTHDHTSNTISGNNENSHVLSKQDESSVEDTVNLPLVIRERDVRYQFKRIVLYRRLLQGYPYTRPYIWKEARTDSLPLYRSFIWAALLGINKDVRSIYESIDKETWTTTDRQIEVDIPRCHQYNPLLASPEGHRKFKRVLKAWVVTNPQYVYWQGLDSLTAPFLLLNFNDEALAYACLSAFIPKYLYGMFRKDNANVIQEYLAKFCHLQAFHDPALFNHLDGIGFIPDLYAIPWVLTMFAHVFPLHNIFHLWDKLLLGNSSFPLCVALAILYQLRDRLLDAEFNDCILLFSDLPAIDIERCVKDSIQIFCSTPRSLTYRKYGSPTNEPRKKNEVDFDSYQGNSKQAIPQALTMESITLGEQKREKVPRISGEEALILLGLAKTRITTKTNTASSSKAHNSSSTNPIDESSFKVGRMTKSRMIVIDVRSTNEFKRGALPESINIPFSKAFQFGETDNGEKSERIILENEESPNLSKEVLEKLSPSCRGGKLICVVGNSKSIGSNNQVEEAQKFAQGLLKMNYNRVCTLHNGIDAFKTLAGSGDDVLIVPNV